MVHFRYSIAPAPRNGKPVVTRRRKTSARNANPRGFGSWVERLPNGVAPKRRDLRQFFELNTCIDLWVNELVTKTVMVDEGETSAPKSKWEYFRIVLFSLGSIAVAGGILLYLSYSHHRQAAEKLMLDLNRDFSRMPFDMVDATEYCQKKLEHKYGEDLALSYVDEHSSRIDSRTGLYKIFMFAHVGDLRDFEEEAVHCFVDPHRRMLTHFRTINLRKASLMSRAAKFFDIF